MYKKECVEELKSYIDIAADVCCSNCDKCCEDNDCTLTQIKNGFANVFGINFFMRGEGYEKKEGN